MPLRLYDTMARKKRAFIPADPRRVTMYVCGPTVYGPPHLGHGRATLVYDVLRRYLESTGISVRLVSNITDIDDRIIERANREQRPWEDITNRCENVWFEAMQRLNVARPNGLSSRRQRFSSSRAVPARRCCSPDAFPGCGGNSGGTRDAPAVP